MSGTLLTQLDLPVNTAESRRVLPVVVHLLGWDNRQPATPAGPDTTDMHPAGNRPGWADRRRLIGLAVPGEPSERSQQLAFEVGS